MAYLRVIGYRVWARLREILNVTEVADSVGAAKGNQPYRKTYFDFPNRVLGRGFIGL